MQEAYVRAFKSFGFAIGLEKPTATFQGFLHLACSILLLREILG